ncbi:MAG: hypothetical protein NE327_15405 [Lentisphaeraceae bacterium]|nr:hypothetical protein [Lentisphaeraceae bacterium]
MDHSTEIDLLNFQINALHKLLGLIKENLEAFDIDMLNRTIFLCKEWSNDLAYLSPWSIERVTEQVSKLEAFTKLDISNAVWEQYQTKKPYKNIEESELLSITQKSIDLFLGIHASNIDVYLEEWSANIEISYALIELILDGPTDLEKSILELLQKYHSYKEAGHFLELFLKMQKNVNDTNGFERLLTIRKNILTN